MKNSRVVLAVEESLAGTVIDEWASRLEARPAPPPEIRNPRIEEVGEVSRAPLGVDAPYREGCLRFDQCVRVARMPL